MKARKEIEDVTKVPTVRKRTAAKPVKLIVAEPVYLTLHTKVAPSKSAPNYTLAQLGGLTDKKHTVKKKTVRGGIKTTSVVVETTTTSIPIVKHTRGGTITKVTGLGLVVFGLTFALVFGSGLVSPFGQKASIVNSLQTSASSTEALICTGQTILLEDKCVNQKPQVLFTVSGVTDTLHDSVPITVTVENATRVSLFVVSKESHTLFPLGVMQKSADNIFTATWSSRTFSDGNYYLQALVENRFGSYEVADPTYVVSLLNILPPGEETVASTTTGEPIVKNASSTKASVHLSTAPQLDVLVGTSSYDFTFTIHAASADGVKLYAKLLPTGEQVALGNAYPESNSLWQFNWKSNKAQVGKYRVTALVYTFNSTSTLNTSTIVTKVASTTVTTIASSTLTNKVLLPDPAVTASVRSDGPQSGSVPFIVQVSDATSVTLYALPTNSLVKTYLGKANLAQTGVWTQTFDSTTIPDGDYTLITVVTNAYGLYESKPLEFSVKNLTIPYNAEATTTQLHTSSQADLDTDHDGLTDDEEITKYKTNPLVADSDNDGFIDGAEVKGGYDPLNPKSESLIAYESPKDTGTEEPDVYAVTSITTALPENVNGTTATVGAVISGKALANSFVTLYIFSTPHIVILKTASDGGWNYHFTEDLENGIHTAYVGVTDNGGKVVAKSAPFIFTKTAEAYTAGTPISAPIVTPVVQSPQTFFTLTHLYVMGGLFVSLVGVVVFLISRRMTPRKQRIFPILV